MLFFLHRLELSNPKLPEVQERDGRERATATTKEDKHAHATCEP